MVLLNMVPLMREVEEDKEHRKKEVVGKERMNRSRKRLMV